MDPLPELFDEVRSGRLPPEAACARLDAAAALHYGGLSRDAGVIYTPKAVARSICRRAIYSYVSRGHPVHNIRVMDSSCGTGIFLEAALEELYRLRDDNGESEYEIKKEIVENNLYGIDVDPYSVDTARMRLGLLLAALGGTGPVNVHIACKNALFGPYADLMHVIVGNPPYMRVKSMRGEQKERLPRQVKASHLYEYQTGNLNLYKLFIERNLQLLKAGGSMGLIIPSSFLNESTSEELRKHIFETCSLEEIIEIPERSRIFPRVNQATAIIVLNKSSTATGDFQLRLGADARSLEYGNGAISIRYDELSSFSDGRMEVPLLSDPSLEWDMIRRLKDLPSFKGGNGIPPVGEVSVGNVDETFDKEFISEEPTGDIFVKGIHLREYAVDLRPDGPQPRWVKKAGFLKKRPSAAKVLEHRRIIGRNTQNKACSRRLKFAMLPPGYLCSNSIKQIVVTDKSTDPYYLMGLLNSSTLNWYFELFCSQNNIRNYRIEALPIVRAPASVQEKFAYVVRMLIASTGDERAYYDGLMDAMAFELYFGGPGLIDAVARPVDKEAVERRIHAINEDKRYVLVTNVTYRRTKNIFQG